VLFCSFLKREFAVESYIFWKEVQDFKLQDKESGRKVSAAMLFDRFVKQGSEDQINIPSGMVKAIEGRISSSDFGQDLFDDACDEIVKMLAKDKLSRFMKTAEIGDRVNIYESCVKTSVKLDEWSKKREEVREEKKLDNEGKEAPVFAKKMRKSAVYGDIFDVTRLFASQIGLLQPYESSMFKVLNVHNDEKKFKNFVRNVKYLDSTKCRESIKVGVLYVAEGQTHQKDILANKRGSREYEEFLTKLGNSVDLAGHKGFNGRLDDKYFANGRTLLYHSTDKVELCFHVATRMPTVETDPQQIAKKRHIGNDFVHIVWSDHKRDYLPCTITSEFNDVVISLYPFKGNRKGIVRVRIYMKEDIKWFGPLSDGMLVTLEDVGDLVRQTAINANRVIRDSQAEYAKPFATRKKLIHDIVMNNEGGWVGGEVFEQMNRL
jgi:hypothetical protein